MTGKNEKLAQALFGPLENRNNSARSSPATSSADNSNKNEDVLVDVSQTGSSRGPDDVQFGMWQQSDQDFCFLDRDVNASHLGELEVPLMSLQLSQTQTIIRPSTPVQRHPQQDPGSPQSLVDVDF